MPQAPIKPFFEAIYRLRNNEEFVLHGSFRAIEPDDESDVRDFLSAEWDNECLEYPGAAPAFNGAAAIWGARTLYTAAQLLLYREQEASDAAALLPPYHQPIDSAAMLSADLCLRMLPDVLRSLNDINSEDPLIPLLETHLTRFHYAAIGYPLDPERLDFAPVASSRCALQLYIDRLVERNDLKLAQRPELSPALAASIGGHEQFFWNV